VVVTGASVAELYEHTVEHNLSTVTVNPSE